MRRHVLLVCSALLLWCFGPLLRAEEPEKVSVCHLQADPAAYNHKVVEVEGFVSHGFEDFTLSDPVCPDWPAVWLEYGGTRKSNTMYCCGPTVGTTRPKELQIEDIPVPLVDNEQFKQFNREIQPPFRSGNFGSIVHTTLVGRFFAGTKQQFGSGPSFWGGYGHMGCCSLLAIQEVKAVSAQDRHDLDYGESAEQPDENRVGCGYRFMTDIWPWQDEIKAQQRAEQNPNSYSFDDPEHVASAFLVAQLKLDASQPLHLTEKRKAQGRVAYEWGPPGRAHSYMVVVSKPFMLSFYANDPKRVAWTVIAAYDSSCDDQNSVTRIR